MREIADRVLWLEDGRLTQLGTLARGPVCGMLVAPERAVRLERETFFFCAAGCREQYEREHPGSISDIPGWGIVSRERGND